MKLTASAISDYLESPKKFFWRYIYRNGGAKFAGVEPITQSAAQYDHDLLIGSCWGEFVTAFYNHADSVALQQPLKRFIDESEGWLSDKIRAQYTEAFAGCMNSYFSQFSPDDGVRTPESSERRVENDYFYGYLDGISADGIIHECKMTSRAPSQETQLWQRENSIQLKLYAVLTQAKGMRVEFAYKDAPNTVWRAPMRYLSTGTLKLWEKELVALGEAIRACGQQNYAYPCHPQGCTIVSKRFVGSCPYRLLCDGDSAAQHFYKERNNDR